MIAALLDTILGPLGGVLASIVAAGAALLVGRRQGAKNERNKGLRDAQERMQAGRDALRDGRGGNPADRLRKNDGKW